MSKQAVYNALKAHPLGLSEDAIAGIMGAIHKETGGTFDYTQPQRGGPGYGLFQYDAQRPAYNEFLEKNDREDSIQSQVDFTLNAIQSGSDIIGAGNAEDLRSTFQTGSAQDVAEDFTTLYLKPKDVVTYNEAVDADNMTATVQSAYDNNITSRRNLADEYVGFGTQTAQAETPQVPEVTNFPEPESGGGFSFLSRIFGSDSDPAQAVPQVSGTPPPVSEVVPQDILDAAFQAGFKNVAVRKNDGDSFISRLFPPAPKPGKISLPAGSGQEQIYNQIMAGERAAGGSPEQVDTVGNLLGGFTDALTRPDAGKVVGEATQAVVEAAKPSVEPMMPGPVPSELNVDPASPQGQALAAMPPLETPSKLDTAIEATADALTLPSMADLRDKTLDALGVPEPEPFVPQMPEWTDDVTGETYIENPWNPGQMILKSSATSRTAVIPMGPQASQRMLTDQKGAENIKREEDLREAAQKEVDETGAISEDTAKSLEIAQNIADADRAQDELDEASRKNLAAVEAGAEQILYNQDVRQQRQLGVVPPSFEEWKANRDKESTNPYLAPTSESEKKREEAEKGPPTVTDNQPSQEEIIADPAGAFASSEAALQEQIGNVSAEERAILGQLKSGIEQAANDTNTTPEEKLGFFDQFKNEIVDMFSAPALANALVGYAGTLLFGGSHAQAGKQAATMWAAYNKQQAAVEAAATKRQQEVSDKLTDNAKDLLKEGFTPASVELYTRTGNESVLKKGSGATGTGAPPGAGGTITQKKANIEGQTLPVYNFGKEHGDYILLPNGQFVSATDPSIVSEVQIYDSSDHSNKSVTDSFSDYAKSSASTVYRKGGKDQSEYKVPNWNTSRIASQANRAFQDIRSNYGVNVDQYGNVKEQIGYAIDDMRDFQMQNPDVKAELRPFIDARMLKVEADTQGIPSELWGSEEFGFSTAKGLASVDDEIRSNLENAGDMREYRAELKNAMALFNALSAEEKEKLKSKGEPNGRSAFSQFIVDY